MTDISSQRFVNKPDEVVGDMLAGFCAAHGDLIVATANDRVLRVRAGTAGRVGIVSGGGSGHEPAFLGYLGPGMLDAVAVGEVFSSPSVGMFLETFRVADSGHGVVCIYGNYAGDNLNVKIAAERAASEGIRVMALAANDDVLSAAMNESDRRRGVAGEILVWKVAAARAREGGNLEEVADASRRALLATRSVGVGLTSCVIPAVGHPNFTIEPGSMEVGIGHHGEPGVRVLPLAPADAVGRFMVDEVLPELKAAAGSRIVVLLSGLGGTPLMECYILYQAVHQQLSAAGLVVHRALVGNAFTALEMRGATLTVMRLDEDLQRWCDRPAACPAWRSLDDVTS